MIVKESPSIFLSQSENGFFSNISYESEKSFPTNSSKDILNVKAKI